MKKVKEIILSQYNKSKDKESFVEELREYISNKLSLHKINPIDLVRWVDISKIKANDYNPNVVAKNELQLLFISIDHDGYTQPIVTIYDEKEKKYIIVDGFHRYYIMRHKIELQKRNENKLPIVVLDKSINDRMASTIRHNRARGKHAIQGISNLVFNLLDNGWTDKDVCKEIGMEMEELVKLKYITGFAKLFKNAKYKKAWEFKAQIRRKKEWENEQR